jgi:hypothetical protein
VLVAATNGAPELTAQFVHDGIERLMRHRFAKMAPAAQHDGVPADPPQETPDQLALSDPGRPPDVHDRRTAGMHGGQGGLQRAKLGRAPDEERLGWSRHLRWDVHFARAPQRVA